MTAFLSYGLFWLSFCFMEIFPKIGYGTAPEPMSVALYLFMWGLFTLGMLVGALKQSPWALCFVFFSLVILFNLLAIHFWTGREGVKIAAGVVGIICGLSAIYVGLGDLLNPIYGRSVVPLGERSSKARK